MLSGVSHLPVQAPQLAPLTSPLCVAPPLVLLLHARVRACGVCSRMVPTVAAGTKWARRYSLLRTPLRHWGMTILVCAFCEAWPVVAVT